MEFSSRHLDNSGVVSLRDAKMLLIEIHQLHLIIRNLLLVWRLEHEVNGVSLVLGLNGDDIIVSCAPEMTLVCNYSLQQNIVNT